MGVTFLAIGRHRAFVGRLGVLRPPQRVIALPQQRQRGRIGRLNGDRLASCVDGQLNLPPLHVNQSENRLAPAPSTLKDADSSRAESIAT